MNRIFQPNFRNHSRTFRRTSASFLLSALFASGLTGLIAPNAALAADFRWTSAGDFLSFDVHAQNETLNSAACAAVYESLVRYDEKMRVEPALAAAYERVPEGFLFTIRENVRFHEGELLTPEDVVFSINRALTPRSQFRSTASGILDAVVTPEGKVLVKTVSGSPVFLRQLTSLRILNKSWAEKHGALEPQNYIAGEESYAASHANGTGPFRLTVREPDVRTEFTAYHDWWDEANRKGNVERVIYTPISSAATRTAALLSGEVDFVLDPAVQDIARLERNSGLRVHSTGEDRVMMVALDQHNDVSPYVKGKDGKPLATNPFKDVRVREAMSIAVNRPGLVRGVMRGKAVATGTIVSHAVFGWNETIGAAPKFDVKRAKALLKEAGYEDGFAFTIDTPNNRWVNDEAMVKALASMWAKIGLDVTVKSMQRAQYFPKVLNFDTSAGLVGWGSSTLDAYRPLQSLSATFDTKTGDGISNIGRASNAQLDAVLKKLAVAEDEAERKALAEEALAIEKREVLHIPLLEPSISWAMKKTVDAPLRPDNTLVLERVRVAE